MPNVNGDKAHLTIEVKRRTDDDHEGHAEIAVMQGDEKIAEGYIGGEAEDNRITRDYRWIVPMLEKVAKVCGARVDVVESEAT